jgi:hypothetical protein
MKVEEDEFKCFMLMLINNKKDQAKFKKSIAAMKQEVSNKSLDDMVDKVRIMTLRSNSNQNVQKIDYSKMTITATSSNKRKNAQPSSSKNKLPKVADEDNDVVNEINKKSNTDNVDANTDNIDVIKNNNIFENTDIENTDNNNIVENTAIVNTDNNNNIDEIKNTSKDIVENNMDVVEDIVEDNIEEKNDKNTTDFKKSFEYDKENSMDVVEDKTKDTSSSETEKKPQNFDPEENLNENVNKTDNANKITNNNINNNVSKIDNNIDMSTYFHFEGDPNQRTVLFFKFTKDEIKQKFVSIVVDRNMTLINKIIKIKELPILFVIKEIPKFFYNSTIDDGLCGIRIDSQMEYKYKIDNFPEGNDKLYVENFRNMLDIDLRVKENRLLFSNFLRKKVHYLARNFLLIKQMQ